jgi:hypothetical protein
VHAFSCSCTVVCSGMYVYVCTGHAGNISASTSTTSLMLLLSYIYVVQHQTTSQSPSPTPRAQARQHSWRPSSSLNLSTGYLAVHRVNRSHQLASSPPEARVGAAREPGMPKTVIRGQRESHRARQCGERGFGLAAEQKTQCGGFEMGGCDERYGIGIEHCIGIGIGIAIDREGSTHNGNPSLLLRWLDLLNQSPIPFWQANNKGQLQHNHATSPGTPLPHRSCVLSCLSCGGGSPHCPFSCQLSHPPL